MIARFSEWERHFPLKNIPVEDGQRRGLDWDPPPSRKADGLEGLLGSAEVEPDAVWAVVCGLLKGQLPDEALAALRRCRTSESHSWPGSKLLLWPPEDDPGAGAVLSAHLGAMQTALASMGIHHALEIEEMLAPAFFEAD